MKFNLFPGKVRWLVRGWLNIKLSSLKQEKLNYQVNNLQSWWTCDVAQHCLFVRPEKPCGTIPFTWCCDHFLQGTIFFLNLYIMFCDSSHLQAQWKFSRLTFCAVQSRTEVIMSSVFILNKVHALQFSWPTSTSFQEPVVIWCRTKRNRLIISLELKKKNICKPAQCDSTLNSCLHCFYSFGFFLRLPSIEVSRSFESSLTFTLPLVVV